MTARLQAASTSGHPILLRTSSSSGHGIGTALDEAIEEQADVFSFLFDQLGIRYSQPANRNASLSPWNARCSRDARS